MNREDIEKILPHRDNMLLLDEVESENGESRADILCAEMNFSFRGIFRGVP